MSANRAASIRARLKNHADATADDFNLVVTRYGIERLLYRLATSEHAPRFLLKGALLFALWYGQPHRPTRDADLLGLGNSRMKDYFDLDQLLKDLEVGDAELRRAIAATFERRQTPVPRDLFVGPSDDFARDKTKHAQWAAFLRKNRLAAVALEVVHRIRERAGAVGVPDTTPGHVRASE
jgi:hypothetical protein